MVATGQAQLVLVSGAAGVGKSMLVHELHRPIAGQRGYFIGGKFEQYQRAGPYATIRQAFRELIEWILTESDAQIAAWRLRSPAARWPAASAFWSNSPQLELVIGAQAAAPELPPLETIQRFQRVFRQFEPSRGGPSAAAAGIAPG